MKPPICELCGKWIQADNADNEAGLVKFADYKALPEGVIGHPQGMEWFCSKHYKAAEKLSELPFDAALERLKEQFQ